MSTDEATLRAKAAAGADARSVLAYLDGEYIADREQQIRTKVTQKLKAETLTPDEALVNWIRVSELYRLRDSVEVLVEEGKRAAAALAGADSPG